MHALLKFETHDIRVIDRNGDPWWVLADVCAVLDHSDPSMAARSLDVDEKGTSILCTPGGDQDMLIVSEPGLYKLLMMSRKPQAKRFDRWVRHEVLPSIRKTGGYGKAQVPEVAAQIIDGLKEALRPLAIRFDTTDQAIERIETRQNAQAEDIATIKQKLEARRKKPSAETIQDHIDAVQQISGGRCPVYPEITIVENGERLPFSDLDHFFASHLPTVDYTWLISRKAHNDITYGRLSREMATTLFNAYQMKRRRLPGRQPNLSL